MGVGSGLGMHTIVHARPEPLLVEDLPQSYIDSRAKETDLLLRLVRAKPELKLVVFNLQRKGRKAETIIKLLDIMGHLPPSFVGMFSVCAGEFSTYLPPDHPAVLHNKRLVEQKRVDDSRAQKKARLEAHRQKIYGSK